LHNEVQQVQDKQNIDSSAVDLSHSEVDLELRAAAVEATANAVVITDLNGTVVWVNPAFERLTGYTEAEMAGQSTRVLNSGQNPRTLYEEMWRTITEERAWHGELINRRKDGSLYDEEMTITPMRDSSGKFSHFIAVKQDITSRRRTDERLSLLSQAMENTSEFIGLGDTNSNITFANQAWLRALGYSEQELVGQNFHFVLSPNNTANIVGEIDAKTFQGGWKGECLQRRKDGTDLPVLLSTGRLTNREGHFAGVFGIARDISERKAVEQEILFKNTLLEAQAETTIDGIMAADEANKVILSNRQFAIMWDVPPMLLHTGNDNLLLQYVTNQIENPEQFLERVKYLYDHREEKAKDEIRLKDGRILDRYSSPLIDSAAKYRGRIWYFRDITERIKAEERVNLWSRVLDQSTEGIFVCDPQERILLVNKAFEKLTGFSADEAVSKTPRIVQSGRQDRAFYTDMWKSVSETGTWSGEMWNRRKNGEFYVEWLSISAVYDHKGAVTHYVGIFSDVTVRKQAEERIVHLANYDALTDLPNRVLLMDRLGQLTKAAQRRKSKVAVVFIDLDRFKEVNDSLGHNAGDLLLQKLAKRLSDAVRDEDTVARLGGDEFVVVFQGLHEAHEVTVLAQKLLSCLALPVTLNGYELTVTASLGISLYPDDAADGQELIRNADAAMYQAKGAGRNALHFYTSDLNDHALEILSMENALRRAIERQEFVLHYQPQINISSGAVVGAEALIRWNHPELGLVMPGKFISIAEERGLIVPIGSWVIEEATRQAGVWQNAGISIPIAVNVSAIQFRQKDFVEHLANSVRKHGITPSRIELELTEGIIMRDAEATIDILGRLHEMGFQLSIDDFGTGFSSLNYLRRFPIDKIKVDQSFVSDVTTSESAASLVTAIVSLAQSLKLKVIAEGVQTKEQLELLRGLRCDEAQGFLFSHALASEEFERLVRDWKPKYLGP
jgi:diguanylate cyclase (GGDEF)-like protein/PAS domain S-box-containing protein